MDLLVVFIFLYLCLASVSWFGYRGLVWFVCVLRLGLFLGFWFFVGLFLFFWGVLFGFLFGYCLRSLRAVGFWFCGWSGV